MTIQKDETNQQYHSNTGAISTSGLKLIKKSPAHYWARYLDPEREEKAPTPAMQFGTAVHCAVLEPAEFDRLYTVIPYDLDRRTKEGKELWQQIVDSGKTPLTQKDWKAITGIINACQQYPELQEMLTHDGSAFEHSVYFDWDGVPCKFRPDMMIAPCERWPRGLILDLKTTSDAGDEFIRSVWQYDYHMQQAFYSEGFQRTFGTSDAPDFVFFAQETESPFANALYYLPDDLVSYGREQCINLLAVYAGCAEDNLWPAYPRFMQCLQMPGWMDRAVNSSDEEIEGISYVTE